MTGLPPKRTSPAPRPPPRLFMTVDAVGGVWTYALDLAAGLSRAGVETTLAVLGPAPDEAQAEAAEAIAGVTLIQTGLPLDWTAASRAEIREAGETMAELARVYGADLVHLNSPALASSGDFPAPVVGACHSCLATWWSAVKDGPMPADFRWRTRALWEGLLACDALIAPTRAFAQAVALTYEVPAPQAVWNGRERMALRGRGGRKPMVFTSGRLWDEGKNVGVLDEAAALLEVPLHAAGPLQGPNGAAVELKHARAHGALSAGQVAEWLQRTPVFATAALYEPFGLGVLEAAQAGCALVLSDIPTLRELWDGAAVFVDPRDASAYAEALGGLFADDARREALAKRARARSARYGSAAMTQGTMDVYRTLRPGVFVPPAREAAA